MFEMQTKFFNRETGEYEWKSIKPTNGPPYRYKTRREAENMLEICYPGIQYEKRVIEV